MATRYDEDFQAAFGGVDRGDLAFFRELARATEGPICEVGAGTGRVLLDLAAHAGRERELIGVEPSAAMRAAFEAKIAAIEPAEAPHIRVCAGAFDTIPLATGSVGLVYAAFRSFQHILTVDGQLAALAELRRVLAPDGTLAIDFFDPGYGMLVDAGPARGLRYRTARGTRVERWEGRRVRRAEQVIEVTFRWVERRGKVVVSDTSETYAIRYTFPAELGHLLARAGLGHASIFGDYTRGPIGPVARELVVVATRPRSVIG